MSFGDLTSMHKLIKTSINLINCSTEQILTMSQNQLTRTDTFIWSVIIVIISNGNKLEIAANQMNLNTNLDLSRDYCRASSNRNGQKNRKIGIRAPKK